MVMMDPNAQVVVRIRTDVPDGQPDPEGERLTALWRALAAELRAVAARPEYAELSPEFVAWGHEDPGSVGELR